MAAAAEVRCISRSSKQLGKTCYFLSGGQHREQRRIQDSSQVESPPFSEPAFPLQKQSHSA